METKWILHISWTATSTYAIPLNDVDSLSLLAGQPWTRLKILEDFSCLVRPDDGKNNHRIERFELHCRFEDGAGGRLAGITVNTEQKAMTMKTIRKTFGIAACVGILAVSATSVFGAALNIFTFDENGNGIYNGLTVPWTMAVEPFSGMTTLTYSLGFATTPGDVLLQESGSPGSVVLSDIVR